VDDPRSRAAVTSIPAARSSSQRAAPPPARRRAPAQTRHLLWSRRSSRVNRTVKCSS